MQIREGISRESTRSARRFKVQGGLFSNDEACILVFSDQLDFEQDLTADDVLLEEALSQIHPRSGQALLSGIAFAAGHLKRIGKNPNRVLLVISDGRAAQASTDSLMFRSQVAGVRIDLIGMDATGPTERDMLSRLAAYSGGKVSLPRMLAASGQRRCKSPRARGCHCPKCSMRQ